MKCRGIESARLAYDQRPPDGERVVEGRCGPLAFWDRNSAATVVVIHEEDVPYGTDKRFSGHVALLLADLDAR